MSQLLEIRSLLVSLYKRYDRVINYVAKFFILLFIYSNVNSFIPGTPFNNVLLTFGLSFLSVFISPKWIVLVLMLTVTGQVYFASIGASILLFLLMFIVYLAFVRMFPKLSLFIIAVPLCFYFKVPLAVPLAAGLFVGLESIIPVSIGVLVYYTISFIPTILSVNTKNVDIFQVPNVIFDVLFSFLNYITTDRELLATFIIFIGVIIITFILKRLSIDYAPYIAMISGTFLYIIGMIMSIVIMKVELNPLFIFIQAILALAVVYIMQFFKVVLNYPRSEMVQFEDDDYYYYVKAVPKIKYNVPKREVKLITKSESK